MFHLNFLKSEVRKAYLKQKMKQFNKQKNVVTAAKRFWEFPNAAPWTKRLQKYAEKTITLSEFNEALKESKCAQFIGNGSNAKVYAACALFAHSIGFMTGNHVCSDCKLLVAVKVPRFDEQEAKNRTYGSLTESNILYEIDIALRSNFLQSFYFSKHILRYQGHYQGLDNSFVLISNYIGNLNSSINLEKLIKHNKCTSIQFLILTVQIFATLHYLRLIIPGFVHMDLTTAQIFLNDGEGAQKLSLTTEYSCKIPQIAYNAVIGDYGLTITDLHPQNKALMIKNGIAVGPTQDLFRYFNTAKANAKGTQTERVINDLIDDIYRGKFDEISQSHTTKETIGLIYLKDFDLVHVNTYADVLFKSKLFSPFLVMNK